MACCGDSTKTRGQLESLNSLCCSAAGHDMKNSFKVPISVTAKSVKQQRECTFCRGDLLKNERLLRCDRCGSIVHEECSACCPTFGCTGELVLVNEPRTQPICIYCTRPLRKKQQIYRCGQCGTCYHATCGDDCPNLECRAQSLELLPKPNKTLKAKLELLKNLVPLDLVPILFASLSGVLGMILFMQGVRAAGDYYIRLPLNEAQDRVVSYFKMFAYLLSSAFFFRLSIRRFMGL